MRSLILVVLLCAALVVPGAVAAADTPNVTCRLDAAAEGAAVATTVDCLQLAPDVFGEFDARVTVTLQARTDDGWTDVASRDCTGRSQEGVLVMPCEAEGAAAAGADVRGVVDLDAPLDWAAAVVDPVYSGGDPRQDPLAEDACHLQEATDSDQTLSDAPWADLCAVFADSAVDEDGDLDHLTIITQVAGLVPERLGAVRWSAAFATAADDCRHTVDVLDDGVGAVTSTVTTRCGGTALGCGPLFDEVIRLTGGSCSSGVDHDTEQTVQLPADAVTFQGDEVAVTLRPADLSPELVAALAPGSEIRDVSAQTVQGATVAGTLLAVDTDTASSTAAVHRIGG